MNVKTFNKEDKPREKLIHNGVKSLSNKELLSIILGSGTKEFNVLETAQKILHQYNHSIDHLSKASISELKKIKGIGDAKAVSIIASLELSNRKKASPQEAPVITCATDAFNELKHKLQHLNHEEFWLLFLSRSNSVISSYCLSKGGSSATIADPKIIFKKALEVNASAIILAHNHPSNQCLPSLADKQITEKIKKGGLLLDISVLDHLIITDYKFFSFAEEGLL